MHENEINFTFEGTPEEIGVDAAIKLLAPVIEGVARELPECAHELFFMGLLSGMTSMLMVNFGAHRSASLISKWAHATQRAAKHVEGPLQ